MSRKHDYERCHWVSVGLSVTSLTSVSSVLYVVQPWCNLLWLTGLKALTIRSEVSFFFFFFCFSLVKRSSMDAPCFEEKKYFCCIEILRAIQSFDTKGLRKICRMQINFLGVHRNLFRQLSTDGNLHGSGMSLVTSSQTYPSGHLGGWTTPWWVEEMRDGQRQRVDIPAHEEKAWRESVLNRPSPPPPPSTT